MNKPASNVVELELALHTGMRRSEQYGMQWEWINFTAGLISVPKSKHGDAVMYA